ncbi:dynein heavy chain 1, cytosolic [Cryptococcus neoformans Tu259-1]|uniref:Dynein heavy chain, cytoplasmic n=1 Tax=Cryptococcus neoformans Tu259-1 TaxID=1230072 RepID=A0A854Q996_CRYNE|nr:dynein heavy chain 1, cytosolic [Cryptococcus neoformans var. grubii AD1-83a]OXG18415.1 dynein heavy chain 1, cytosolic [Cryptococcus neoformans var. grubii Tu259-1]OXG56313.1 dynein heavy chain 1, cytosolic [Cryptococcus neoformans var. grubii MW-RSA1955]OXG60140.1 dynein heavy chain 1, cytosolic [Cryptococcus neoformans var. grubii CHC193]OXG61806.1 dynein heavy chain 1, cytosolic [Cryptococcus neoformans var. grubii c8]
MTMASSQLEDGALIPPSTTGGLVFDVAVFRTYLQSLLPLVMSATPQELEDSLFEDPNFDEKTVRFATDASCQVVYITRERYLDVDEDGIPTARITYRLHLPPTPPHSPNTLSTLALIKTSPTIDSLNPLGTQLHFLQLSSAFTAPTLVEDDGTPSGMTTAVATPTVSASAQATPYDGLHSLVHWGVAPWFDSYVSSKQSLIPGHGAHDGLGKKGGEAQMGIPVTKKKFAELELSLLHLKQNVEIPEVHLSVHPAIRKAVAHCNATNQRVSPDAVEPQSLLSDPSFLNKLQADVNSWIKEIQAVTKLNRDVASGTASQEINFWISMEHALEGIEQQLGGEEVTLVLDVLKHAKRFHATVSFIADTGLKEAADLVHKHNILMKDFPLDELLAATDLEKIQDAIYLIFAHINKKLKLSPYPIRRTLPLVEAISSDFNDQLLKVLSSQRLMYMDYTKFEEVMATAAEVFGTWDENMKDFTNVAREVSRKRAEKFISIKINPIHAKLQERITYLRAFRRSHEQLRVMTSSTRSFSGLGNDVPFDIDMEEEVRLSYENVKNVDVLDVSPEGSEIWYTAETAYNDRVARIENQIISRLRDKLATARNAQEMFRVFSKFNTLFVRPKIRGAIQEYQTRLIESVKEDIHRLRQKFTENYRNSQAYHMSQMRDFPSVSSAIIWARQIERQLLTYMKRVEDVLGKGWESYAEGHKLQMESASFRVKLDTRPLYDAWISDITKRGNLTITGRLFDVIRTRATATNAQGQLQLVVQFDPQVIALFKEVRSLIWLGFPVPLTISHKAKDAKRVYPHAVSLMESVKTYTQTLDLIERNPEVAILLARYRSHALQMIERGIKMQWDHLVNAYEGHRFLPGSVTDSRESRHFLFVREFASVVSLLQDKANALIEIHTDINRVVEELAICEYTSDTFSSLLGQIQKTIDHLNLENYSNLDAWVATLNEKIDKVLSERLINAIEIWCAEFGKDEEAAGGDVAVAGGNGSRGDMNIEPLVHEIRIRNQVIYLDPPIELARQEWLGQFQDALGVICNLCRIRSSRYEISLQAEEASLEETTYIGLLTSFADGTLEKPLALIEDKVQTVSSYVNKWLQFQSLWDLEAEYVYNRLGDSLADWGQLLSDIRQTRSTFDTADTKKDFGVCVIDYANAQSKVNAKYDSWQRELLARYGAKLGVSMKDTYNAILKARTELEGLAIEGSSTARAVSFITFVQDLKRKVQKWGPEIEEFDRGQKTLERQRYSFPADWLYIDQIQGEWGAFSEILKRKDDSIKEQVAGLQLKIVAEDKVIDQRIRDFIAEWEENKPLQGSIKAETAINTLNVFEGRLARLLEEYNLVCRAKEALDLEHANDDRLQPVNEELRDLKAVWTALSGIWGRLAQLRETLWTAVQPRKLRQELDAILSSTRDMPSRMRQYAAFEYVQDTIKTLLKSNILIGELKSEALRERHWSKLYKALRMPTQQTSLMTLDQVYNLDLKRNEVLIKEVVVQAQGEMALEEFIKQVKETWTSYSLDLINYQSKCRLIRSWDDLFNKCGEHLNSLTAMRMSPYYRIFEEDAASWEDKLNRIHVLFDVWIDVQRQWVYLEGIFSGSADIKHLLPVESTRFQNINSEFLIVMKRVNKSPFVLDVLNIPGIQKNLERLADLLTKIQKALGEYLEKERSSFPRFYFVGDEDLLEIIGNSKDTRRIMKHLKKMFAGISTLQMDEEETQLLGFSSREGEEVYFRTPIVLKDFPKINDWLAKVESEMRISLAYLLSQAVTELNGFFKVDTSLSLDDLLAWTGSYPAQLVVLAVQVAWTNLVESSIATAGLTSVLALVSQTLDLLADTVLQDIAVLQRRKCEHLITELVHQRDVIRSLITSGTRSTTTFDWLYHMRFYLNESVSDPLLKLEIRMADAVFPYGYEYLGIPDRLVQTPLTDRCYLTLTQALGNQFGGSPFGPAGTGKTESVKSLGVQLGRFVLVFCCDETFDFQAMGRIFIGLCQVGAWGCFDEFNRLEERILSAVSQQVQSIQQGLAHVASNPDAEVELVGKKLKINSRTGIFITMNPGYAGRSNLPDNLKKLFRSMAMTRPDQELIAQVLLFSKGFRTAEVLASKVVPFFNLCAEQLSDQPHYDFGLRALKSVLASAGILKRDRHLALEQGDGIDSGTDGFVEQQIMIQSVTETIVPKLVADDVPLLKALLEDVFPGIEYVPVNLDALKAKLDEVCKERHLIAKESWLEKVVQLYQIQNISHGLMMVGPSGSGKTQAWQVLLAALERLDGIEGASYVIDPKAIDKEALYGTLDATTREWNDGLFTHILRKIVDNVRGETAKRHWIIFDGDVDPEWVENLNSVLDDNKLLTLPNGERLNLPPNVRIMFEVEHLRYATLATVSRCGMIWFSEDVIDTSMIYNHHLDMIAVLPIGTDEDETLDYATGVDSDTVASRHLEVQRQIVDMLKPHFQQEGLVNKALEYAAKSEHIMEFTSARALNTLFSLLKATIRHVLEYNTCHSDFPLSTEKVEAYVLRRLLLNIIWAFVGDAKLDIRAEMGKQLVLESGIETPPLGPGASLIDYDVDVSSADWVAWQSRVPTIEVETHAITSADVVIPTIDTVRHEEVLYSWLAEHKPLILCGPPGSGKTMTLFSALRKLPDLEVVGLNFSSATTPELILKTFEQYCEYRKTPNGVILAPTQIGRWLVVFCDEINLPATDKYGTQRVISFLRQLMECNGFWRTSDLSWVKMERIQFVGACNPPTDPGRVPLNHRFMRHAPVVMVDYPGEISLKQIYGTFNRALLKVIPILRGHSDALTDAMVSFYLASQKRFTADIQAHYIYSPRELTRWSRGIYEAIKPLETLSVEGLLRVWAHEALRLFQDRLVAEEEKQWTDDLIDATVSEYFPSVDVSDALARPILFSNWTSRNYIPVNREQLREYTKARLKVFYEEELDVQLVLFNDVLDHVLRIDRVFRQIQGHLLLIGVSGGGKTTLSRFVAWMNGLSIYQIKVSNKYTGADFDEDLRTVLRRAGCKGEKICFIMDESNVLDSGFLERMNTLLANAEVPGLFEGDEYAALMTACKEGSQRDGLMLDSHEELYRWFTQQVARNLHVVFTMNPPANGLASRAATSPALFNRCVLDWFGDWSDQALYQVGLEFTQTLDLDMASYVPGASFPTIYRDLPVPPSHRQAVVNAMVYVHQSMQSLTTKLAKRQGKYNHVTPRHFLDFINHYVRLFNEKKEDLEEQQRHLNVGLDKLRETVSQVEELRHSLAAKSSQLEEKNDEANQKLKQMVTDQQEAEAKKAASIDIQAALERQDEFIRQRQEVVKEDLALAEPAVLEALAAVGNIKKQHLSEVRSMANPPEAVKMAMESACTVLGHQIDSWRTVQGIIRREDFISSIQNFDTKKMSKTVRDRMNRDYISKPTFNFETVNRASRACGPLVQWVIAQVRYSEILEKVAPLRQEVASLEKQADATKQQVQVAMDTIAELESSIDRYKEEYALLISETQSIKSEMDRVQTKVDRSMTLLQSLSSEQERWDTGSKTFETEMGTIVGDVMVSAAFLAYSGFFDQHYRDLMKREWMDHLSEAGISYKHDLALSEFLSTADERLGWQANALPADNLCIENAVMLKRYNRYPLIVDPTGQATAFLQNEYRDRKITITSFLDESFLKKLESALRFGNPLLIQDVENLDPILNSVLNRELRRTGGRVLIRIGNQDIDFSPAFTMFLSTRDPSVEFSPDICSRVTFVNFTMTRSSLQTQALDKVLKAERPKVDQKRTDLMKLQGEFRLRLNHLERSLLQALNESTGSILDDDKVIGTLEVLKKEAAEITRKVEDTEIVMREVEAVTEEYQPLAQACSGIYFTLEQLASINHFYQFSLDYFLEIFDYVLLRNPRLKGVSDMETRKSILLQDIFLTAFQRTSRSLLHTDYLVLSVTLAKLRLRGEEGAKVLQELDAVLDVPSGGMARDLKLTMEQKKSLDGILDGEMSKVLEQDLINNEGRWRLFMAATQPEKDVPWPWSEGNALFTAARRMLVIKIFRPDRLLQSMTIFADLAFDIDLAVQADYDVQAVVTEQVGPTHPVVFVSVPGYDASYRVENLCRSMGVNCTSVALGSAEGFTLADQAIAEAARTGSWVLLKNVHLAPGWLAKLEKRLHSLSPNHNFRLFLTMETNPVIPVNILRQSRIIMNEPAPGVRANLLDTLRGIPQSLSSSGPAERPRLFFLLAWFHSVVQERLRYLPLGWSKSYEFNDSDFDAALNTINSWITALAKGKANVDPVQIPWVAIRTLIKQAVYGGRVDSDYDQRVVDAFVDKIFTPRAYDPDFKLVELDEGQPGLSIPEGTQMSHFIEWAHGLPEREPPSWLSLPPTAEGVVAAAEGDATMVKLRKMRTTEDDEDDGDPVSGASLGRPAWMTALKSHADVWLSALPEALSSTPHEPSHAHSPLSRFFVREASTGSKLLKRIRHDLFDLIQVCLGNLKQTNELRALMSDLNRGTVPAHWCKFKMPRGTAVSQYINNLAARLAQLERLANGAVEAQQGVWLGGLFQPEAYITATRQAVAHDRGWSLEQLVLGMDISQTGGQDAFAVQGLTLQGASWACGRLQLNEGQSILLPPSQLTWRRHDEAPQTSGTTMVNLPVYLNGDRSDVLFSVDLEADEGDDVIAQRGVCLTAA